MILVVAGCFLTFTRTVHLQWHAVVCKVFPATSLLMDMSLACLCAVDALQISSVHTCFMAALRLGEFKPDACLVWLP